jgi:hypothetical protein
MTTARDVTVGNCNAVPGTGVPGGHPAGPGPDLATGTGLVDAHKAVMLAKVRCLGPITPIIPITPITGPITPITAITPITRITPVTPITGITPITPITRITPITAITPPRPGPGPDPGPIQPGSRADAGPQRLSEEDVAALEKLIQEGDINLGS